MQTKRVKNLLADFIRGSKCNIEALKTYVKLHGDINVVYKQTTALCECCRKGWTNGAMFIISQGGDVDLADGNGSTPLYIAASHGWDDIVKLLVESKCDLNRPNANRFSPLVSSVQNGHERCTHLLIEAGASVNVTRPDTRRVDITLLSYVLFGRGDYALGEKLIHAGAMPHKFFKPMGFILLEETYMHLWFAKTLLAAGFQIDCAGWMELLQYREDREISDKQRELLRLLEQENRGPPPLQRLCRTRLRHVLAMSKAKGHIRTKVDLLPLPQEVKKYVLLDYL